MAATGSERPGLPQKCSGQPLKGTFVAPSMISISSSAEIDNQLKHTKHAGSLCSTVVYQQMIAGP